MTPFRWLLLPLLIYLLGQYFEGPPYRVIVRSLPFMMSCFYLSIVAAMQLHQRSELPLLYLLLQALLVPVGFVFTIQNYYNGGINADYSLAVLFFTILMGFNGIIYCWSLFSFHRQSKLRIKSARIKSYDLKLCYLDDDGNLGEIKYHDQGITELPEAMVIDGFSEDRYIDLRDHWETIIADQLEKYQTDITTYETIIKFGDTMQLTDKYRLTIKVTYL